MQDHPPCVSIMLGVYNCQLILLPLGRLQDPPVIHPGGSLIFFSLFYIYAFSEPFYKTTMIPNKKCSLSFLCIHKRMKIHVCFCGGPLSCISLTNCVYIIIIISTISQDDKGLTLKLFSIFLLHTQKNEDTCLFLCQTLIIFFHISLCIYN